MNIWWRATRCASLFRYKVIWDSIPVLKALTLHGSWCHMKKKRRKYCKDNHREKLHKNHRLHNKVVLGIWSLILTWLRRTSFLILCSLCKVQTPGGQELRINSTIPVFSRVRVHYVFCWLNEWMNECKMDDSLSQCSKFHISSFRTRYRNRWRLRLEAESTRRWAWLGDRL